MNARKLGAAAAILFLAALIAVAIPAPAMADGGPAVAYELWTSLKEGQQVAVVTILDQDRARVDLFISILDKTEQSHEIVFFIPLGTKTSYFNAVEKKLLAFDQQATRHLDKIIRDSATRKQRAVQILFSGALLTNGALLVPLWAPVLLTGCAAAEPKPDVTLQTESSQIAVYGIEEDTNLDALVQTTGLPPSVADTLSRLKGQQIAVVKLQTKPQGQGGTATPPGEPSSEPGLHLSWQTTLVPGESGTTYAYPLGTGEAWSKPIELTRVYVVAPKGIDFDIQYPRLGSDQSGFDIIEGARISRYFQIPSYAIDEARGSFGRVWRATYTMSNPREDIVITAKAQSAYSRFLARAEDSALMTSLFFAVVIGLLVWVLAWTWLMPRFLWGRAGPKVELHWYHALAYPGINIVLMVFPGSAFYLFFLLGMPLPSLLGAFLVLGGAVIGLFWALHSGHLGVNRGRAIGAFVLTSLCGSAAYLVLAVIFARIINVI
jgi:hypothetical protein